ncbi:hypothetical protein BHO_0091800 [Borrelia hermsii YBT]|nr:hypothetical protein BHO_0091800 [Borrelia hermsii YBT]
MKSGMYATKPMLEYPMFLISFGIARVVSIPENAARQKYLIFIFPLFLLIFIHKNILHIKWHGY